MVIKSDFLARNEANFIFSYNLLTYLLIFCLNNLLKRMLNVDFNIMTALSLSQQFCAILIMRNVQ